MRKKHKIIVFLLTFCSGVLFSQGSSGESFTSAPSATSIKSFINAPISLSTGVPDINIPFFALATHNPGIGINVGISYHPNNSAKTSRASDVGLGWSLYGTSCLIYRATALGNENEPSATYYYSFMGFNGKFLLKNDPQLGKYIRPLTETNLDFTYMDDDTFKVVDPSGNTYFFNNKDQNIFKKSQIYRSYASTYYLTKIKDVHQNESLLFDYIEDSYVPSLESLSIKSLKVSKVTSPDFGSIEFSYNFDEALRKKVSDPYQLHTVVLKNKAGKVIQKYTLQNEGGVFMYTDPAPSTCPLDLGELVFNEKRKLSSIQKYGTSSQFEKTSFEYTELPSSENNWAGLDCLCLNGPGGERYLKVGLLNTIKYPTGGQTRYEFEPNQYEVKKTHIFDPLSNSDEQYINPSEYMDHDAQVLEDVGTFNFDTHFTDTYTFNLPPNPDNSEGASYLVYCLNVGAYYTDSPVWEPGTIPSLAAELTSGVIGSDWNKKFMPGTNTFKISGTGGGGNVTIKRIRYRSIPLPNYTTTSGFRIKKIEFLENGIPVDSETRYYSYQQFDDNSKTSGAAVWLKDNTVVYKNVKETIGQNKGYARYYFKTLMDHPDNQNASTNFSHYNILINGLLDKKEIFDASNNIVTKEENIYELTPTGLPYSLDDNTNSGFPVKNSIVTKQTNTTTSFVGQDAISSTIESTRETINLNITGKKTITPEGDILEENYKYPKQVAIRLFAAGIRDRVITTESKKNGATLSKTETRYDDTSHLYPTSVIGFLPDDLTQSFKNAVNDIYDDKGNLVQYRAFPNTADASTGGIPTTIIWGYNKTMPIAKIEGAKLSDIPAALITTIINASNEDADATPANEAAKETALMNALNTFRKDTALKNFVITAYTYDPMIGMTTTISPNGMMAKYQYDSFNRLQKVINNEGITVKEYQYNNKN
ncbi:hypothetical protein SAMN06265171_1011070 [Chryseobacterium rhizoplanae]|uniref:YD repeat-containing protein n=1 Tax=Chryseobacterium rhizoplanae TaxID=1609531 RepID=A0A521BJL1_9FLAO|nr:hypothetical protein [Chryseobacterium rhizoplanae]SMO47357.1 hypothetical protein SAMN06265171_1011070 [Chryseobacterium rhizoplanae]